MKTMYVAAQNHGPAHYNILSRASHGGLAILGAT